MLHTIPHPSPNHEPRPGAVTPSLVIIHYTGMADGTSALARLCDPVAKVSAHYVVEEDGRVFALVAEDRRAWHAGVSCWGGVTDVNSASIGIEVVNPGHAFGYRAFPPAQMQAVLALCQNIKQRLRLPAAAFWGHSDIAPARKEDPGELFDWHFLAQNGVGIWPKKALAPAAPPSIAALQALLGRIGYACPQSGMADATTQSIITAFQRHFYPPGLTEVPPPTGVPGDETCWRIAAVARGITEA